VTVVDAHQHVWNLDRADYPYLRGVPALYRTFEETELEPQLEAAGVDRTVLVQSMDSYADTGFMLEVAARWPRVAGIVGWVPLNRPDEAAAALDRYARAGRLVGIRHLIHEDPDPDWLLRDDVGEGLGLLAERGLTFDVVAVSPRHLEHVPVLAARHPGLRMVIDHLAKPPIAARGWEPWASRIRDAAESPKVYAKVSGLDTAADWSAWTAADLQPYVDHVLDVFGPARLMFGGDWPVCTLAGGYGRVWRATAELLAGLDAADRARVLGGTATEFYRLDGSS
jgi:L-fuconolactonase